MLPNACWLHINALELGKLPGRASSRVMMPEYLLTKVKQGQIAPAIATAALEAFAPPRAIAGNRRS